MKYLIQPMSKQKKPAQKPEEIPEQIKHGELFVKQTYLRLYRAKGLSTEQAETRLSLEIKKGTVTFYQKRGEIQIYRKQ